MSTAEDEAGARRPGEVAVTLPERTDAGVHFIGRIRTPWTRREECPKNPASSDAPCTIELDPRFAQGLADLETFSHVIVLYWMDRAARDLVVQRPRSHGAPRGVFALRSPARPNPIALSCVRLERIEGTHLHVRGLDCLDGTPLIDLKPYLPSIDCHPDASFGWKTADTTTRQHGKAS
ncbi:tRNA (N6-threonylcarbamoyladenosine(37)-N6)-methyltransferase TrmO [Salinarimonas rosea]|uniref:tRNA (N6-threonylcarbamoyladenosine(37)-N6)-methyltransferase TrmO n=1 Tax=Salinarimonas rosea TaxID=552063 RepID=UPI00040E54DD|nr:tRNA (N6-threonylcarbamoyladenosine(37)-N6)-methyltransferase TrmO [Salinarimonas rosea]